MPAGSSAALATGAKTVRAGIVQRTSTSASTVASAKRSIAGCCRSTVLTVGHNVQCRLAPAIQTAQSLAAMLYAGSGALRPPPPAAPPLAPPFPFPTVPPPAPRRPPPPLPLHV